MDHTYKWVSCFGAHDDATNSWVQFTRVIFGRHFLQIQVLNHKIVPTDERTHVEQALKEIWDTVDRTVITLAVYTDNAKTDKNTIETAFAATHSKEEVEMYPIDVCEVLLFLALNC